MQSFAVETILCDRQIAYILTDRQLRITETGGATSLLGRSLNDTICESLPELIGNEAALADVLNGILPRLILPWINRELPDGRTRYLTLVILPSLDAAGAIQGLLLVIQDMTEMGRLEQRVVQQRNELLLLQDALRTQNRQLEAANIELHRLDELKSAFVSIAAHELRTPLASISGYLEMLLDGDAGPLAARQAEWVRIIEGSASRLLRITNDLLDVTRIEAGRLELVMQPADLAAIVRTVIAEHVPQVEARGQSLRLETPAHLAQTLCNTARAAQIIGNLISNASKYSPAGSVITIRLRQADDPGFIEVTVSDQGPGILPEHQARLFTPFYRAPAQATGSVSGAGLGLYIARALSELHGGRIWLTSVPGHGATFYVTFPTFIG